MPELPEVEQIVAQLAQDIARSKAALTLREVFISPKALRFNLSVGSWGDLVGYRLSAVARRGKYLIFEFSKSISSRGQPQKKFVLNSLGMTGAWRWVGQNPQHKPAEHDHLVLNFGKTYLVYSDPRRFGFFELSPTDGGSWARIEDLGPEPLGPLWELGRLQKCLKTKSASIKAALMDPAVVVGVGNIYASEALFRSGIRPQRRCCDLDDDEVCSIQASIRGVLTEAILSGGSTVRSYVNAHGTKGQFQEQLFVYGRAGLPCLQCRTKVISVRLAGRSSFYCPHCQK